jgi:hypothetical protein
MRLDADRAPIRPAVTQGLDRERDPVSIRGLDATGPHDSHQTAHQPSTFAQALFQSSTSSILRRPATDTRLTP